MNTTDIILVSCLTKPLDLVYTWTVVLMTSPTDHCSSSYYHHRLRYPVILDRNLLPDMDLDLVFTPDMSVLEGATNTTIHDETLAATSNTPGDLSAVIGIYIWHSPCLNHLLNAAFA